MCVLKVPIMYIIYTYKYINVSESEWLQCQECHPFAKINDGNMFQEDKCPAEEVVLEGAEEL